MSEATEKPITIIKLDPAQFRDLVLTIDYVTKELKNINNQLARIEGELALIRVKMKE